MKSIYECYDESYEVYNDNLRDLLDVKKGELLSLAADLNEGLLDSTYPIEQVIQTINKALETIQDNKQLITLEEGLRI